MPPLPYNLINVLISVNFRMRTVIPKEFNLRLCESRVWRLVISDHKGMGFGSQTN